MSKKSVFGLLIVVLYCCAVLAQGPGGQAAQSLPAGDSKAIVETVHDLPRGNDDYQRRSYPRRLEAACRADGVGGGRCSAEPDGDGHGLFGKEFSRDKRAEGCHRPWTLQSNV